MNKQEYRLGLRRIDTWSRVIPWSAVLLFFVGIPLAAVTPPPFWNKVALLAPYFAGIFVMISDPLRLFVNYNAMAAYKNKVLDAYNGDKTAYLLWQKRRFRSLPLYSLIYHSQKAASRRVIINAVNAYPE